MSHSDPASGGAEALSIVGAAAPGHRTPHLPYIGKSELELLFDYVINTAHGSLRMRAAWDEAVAGGRAEQFLGGLCRRLSVNGCNVSIVRTREDGSKIVTDLSEGFVTTVFDVPI